MTSPQLERPLRSRQVAIEQIIANMSETYVVVDMASGVPYMRETDLGQTFDRVVRDLLDGEYDHRTARGSLEAPVAVLRVCRDGCTNANAAVADAMIAYLLRSPFAAFDDEGELYPRPFLDNVRPDWRDAFPRERKAPPEYEPPEAA